VPRPRRVHRSSGRAAARQRHQDRTAFETDRRRDAVTLAAGYGTVRITAERLDDVEAARLRQILESRA
jgi:hypothetical protein